MVEGAGRTRTRLTTWGHSVGEHVIVARITLRAEGTALSTRGSLFVNEAEIVATSSGVTSAFEASGQTAVCRSIVRAAVGGAALVFDSAQLVVAGSAIAACHYGVEVAYASHDVQIVGNTIQSLRGVDVVRGSHAITIERNVFDSQQSVMIGNVCAEPLAAPPIDYATACDQDVTIRGNTLITGALPEPNEAARIVVENNTSL